MWSQPEESLNNEPVAEETELEDVASLKQALAEEKAKSEANLAGWQRAQADFMNYKKRAEQDREEFTRFANANLITSLLPILDDLDRALEQVPARSEKAAWVDGVRLISRKLRATLEAQGLKPIEAVGKPFDPSIHDAVRQDKGEEGMVVEEVRKGYTLHDRVIRPSMVVVGNGEDTEKEAE
jgi:molecular chaperone GrpE